jgi:hypothetical protein
MTTGRSMTAISVNNGDDMAASAVAGVDNKAEYSRTALTALVWTSHRKGHALVAAIECIGGGMAGAIVQDDACSGT